MGEVYRARDSGLSRQVEIKAWTADIACDDERLKRVQKEARAASSVNHPSIVTIYEIGQEGPVAYIAMELVEGKTLREVLSSGPLPVRKLLQIGTRVSDGLAAAHEAGIVHRDLKPENVMVTKDGLAKILDFGVAKLSNAGSGSEDGTSLPTQTVTMPGVVLGTVGYMSPEQAGGRAVDFRSDQFSFGSLLYEMARFRSRSGGSSSGASPRTRKSATPRPKTWLGISHRSGTTSPTPPAWPSRSRSPRRRITAPGLSG
jgi:serine/threonine protein kinase